MIYLFFLNINEIFNSCFRNPEQADYYSKDNVVKENVHSFLNSFFSLGIRHKLSGMCPHYSK